MTAVQLQSLVAQNEMLQEEGLKTFCFQGSGIPHDLTSTQCYCLLEWGGNELKTYFSLQWKEGVVFILSSVCGSNLFSSLVLDCSCTTLTILTFPSPPPFALVFWNVPGFLYFQYTQSHAKSSREMGTVAQFRCPCRTS